MTESIDDYLAIWCVGQHKANTETYFVRRVFLLLIEMIIINKEVGIFSHSIA